MGLIGRKQAGAELGQAQPGYSEPISFSFKVEN